MCLTHCPRTVTAATLSGTSACAWVLEAGDQAGDRPVVALGDTVDRLVVVEGGDGLAKLHRDVGGADEACESFDQRGQLGQSLGGDSAWSAAAREPFPYGARRRAYCACDVTVGEVAGVVGHPIVVRASVLLPSEKVNWAAKGKRWRGQCFGSLMPHGRKANVIPPACW